MKYFDLNGYIKKKKLYDSYDRKAKTYDVDVNTLKSIVEPLFKTKHSRSSIMDKLVDKILDTDQLLKEVSKEKFQGVIVDSHLSHYIDSDYCIIIKTDIKKMYERLNKRKYPKEKIQENIQSEIFEICLDEARGMRRRSIIVNN
jgi:adenylate kinase